MNPLRAATVRDFSPVKPKAPRRFFALRRARGFTLVEVMVAFSILIIVAGAILQAAALSRKTTNQAMIQLLALEAAQGFLDQLKAMKYGSLKNALAVVDSTQKADPQVKLMILTRTFDSVTVTASAVKMNIWTPVSLYRPRLGGSGPMVGKRQDALSIDDKSVSVPNYAIRVAVEDYTDANIAAGSAYRVTVYYQYTDTDTNYRINSVSCLVPNFE